jgi:hypothetical protein
LAPLNLHANETITLPCSTETKALPTRYKQGRLLYAHRIKASSSQYFVPLDMLISCLWPEFDFTSAENSIKTCTLPNRQEIDETPEIVWMWKI